MSGSYPDDQAVGHGLDHQLARTHQHLGSQLGPVLEDVAEALVEDLVGPARAKETGPSEPHQQIAKRRGVEHARVVDDDERHQ